MRRLIISNLYPPNSRGGAENLVKSEAEAFLAHGDEVLVFTGVGVEVEADGGVFSGVEVVSYVPRLPYFILDDVGQPLYRRLVWHFLDLIGVGGSRKVFDRVLEEFKPDVIMTHNLRGMEMGFLRSLRGCGVAWTHVLHDIQLVVPSGMLWLDRWSVWQSRVVVWLYSWWTRRLFGSPDVVISPSRALLDEHLDRGFFGGSQVVVLENPVDVGLDGCGDCVLADSASFYGGSEGVLELLFVGQLVESKGVMVLMRALALVDFDVRLVVVGDGGCLDEMMEIADGLRDGVDVEFVGRVSHADVFEFMRKSDGLVVPSVIFENCPGVILEARAFGLAVLASRQGGIPEFVDESGLFEVGSVLGLVERIRDLREGRVFGRGGGISTTEWVEEERSKIAP